MKFFIIPVIMLVFFSSVSYALTDAEFKDIMNQLNDKIEYLQSNIAQLKQDLMERIGNSEDYILTEQQNMMAIYAEELEYKIDPMSFSMPVITFILVILGLYCGLLGTWYSKYYFFKRKEDYFNELEKKKKEYKELSEQKSETEAIPEEKIKGSPYEQIERERVYREMVQKQKQEKMKGVIMVITLIFVFLLALFFVIIPLM